MTHQARQGGEIEPDVGLEDEGLGTRQAVDRHTFEAPALHSGIAAFGGITRVVVEAFPCRSVQRDIAYQTEGAVVESKADIFDQPERAIGSLIRTLRRGIE